MTRYTRAGWSMARCGRAFGISTDPVRRILLARGVPLRGTPGLDEAAIVAAYQCNLQAAVEAHRVAGGAPKATDAHHGGI